MLGWMILFAMLSVPGLSLVALGAATAVSITAASVLFALLFVLCLLTRLARSRV